MLGEGRGVSGQDCGVVDGDGVVRTVLVMVRRDGGQGQSGQGREEGAMRAVDIICRRISRRV